MREDSDLVGIKGVETELEGLHLRDILINEGIECELFSFHDSALDGISQNWAEGNWGELRVFEEDREKGVKILEEFERSQLEDQGETEE